METNLILSRGGFPPFSARGCVQHLMPIESGMMRRTINGKLVYIGKSLMHKYRSIISCEDKTSLALDGIWRGSDLRVGCIQFIWQKVQGKEAVLERDPVEGSVFAMTSKQQERGIKEVYGRKIILHAMEEEETFVSYRPWLDMRVVSFSLMTNEWGLQAGWRLELEEI
jgi:hypothetical protein